MSANDAGFNVVAPFESALASWSLDAIPSSE